MSLIPPLTDFEPTRQTLHLYAQAMAVVLRAHGTSHPNWWHISLRVTPNGLRTAAFRLPNCESGWLEMDMVNHLLKLHTSIGGTTALDMQAGATGSEMGTQILTEIAELGLEGEYARDKFANDDERFYDPERAAAFLVALTNINSIFAAYRAKLVGKIGPIQLWPHGFDLAFEWYGTRTVVHEENGEIQTYPAQLNLGFFPGGEPYFYSNPWPFASEQLLDQLLPPDALWHTEGWQGAMMPYTALVGDSAADKRLTEFASRVYALAAPTLMS